ncbi:MAG: periplasmic heavy metal sensor [Myxococcota bacterium]
MNPLTKRLAIFLAISLGVNLLLGGFMLGRRFHGRHEGPHPPGIGMMRDKLHKRGMGAMHPGWREFQRANRAARERAADAFEHEPFDPAALDAALSALREETARGQKALHDQLAQQAKSGDAELRRGLARAFRRAPMRSGE